MNYEKGTKLRFILLPSSLILSSSAGLPLTSAASRPATETQGPTAQLQKLVAGRGINTSRPGLQASIFGRARLGRGIGFQPMKHHGLEAHATTESRPIKERRFEVYPSTMLSGSSFVDALVLGKWAAKSLPTSSIAS